MEKWNKIIDLKSDAASYEVINDRILSDMTIGGFKFKQYGRYYRGYACIPLNGQYFSCRIRNGDL